LSENLSAHWGQIQLSDRLWVEGLGMGGGTLYYSFAGDMTRLFARGHVGRTRMLIVF